MRIRHHSNRSEELAHPQNEVLVLKGFDQDKTIYYIPVYTHAAIEDIVGIDYERRTVTAHFVLYITQSLKFPQPNPKLKEFLQQHLILEFGYNQQILIPETMKADNTPYMIKKMVNQNATINLRKVDSYINRKKKKKSEKESLIEQDFAEPEENLFSFKIEGNFQCPAIFDLTFFPYRHVTVTNQMCFRTQFFENYEVKYNVMVHVNKDTNLHPQFYSRYSNYKFGAYILNHQRILSYSDVSKLIESSNQKRELKAKIANSKGFDKILKAKVLSIIDRAALKSEQQLIEEIYEFSKPHATFDKTIQVKSKQNRFQQKDKIFDQMSVSDSFNLNIGHQIVAKIVNINIAERIYANELISSSKYINFQFEMHSLKIASVLKEQIPIWILTLISLFLFQAPNSIGNRYSSIILLIVSYIAVITNFRSNNVSQPVLTFYEMKIMALTIVPILLTITSSIDFYHEATFQERGIQIQNQFFIASLALSGILFFFTVISLLVISYKTRWAVIQSRLAWRIQGFFDRERWLGNIGEEWGNHLFLRKMYVILAVQDLLKQQKDQQ